MGAELETLRHQHPAVPPAGAPPGHGRPRPARVRISFQDRHALVVVRGVDYREDLAALKRSGYLREVKPVLIGVDGGADALLRAGPEARTSSSGDFDSVSDDALRCGAELIVHAYLDGKAPGAERLQALGPALRAVRDRGHQRGHRHAAGPRARRRAHRGRRHPQLDGGVPRQGPGRHGVDVPRPPAGRCVAGRRQGREPALPAGGQDPRHLASWCVGALAALLAVTLVNEPLRLWLRSLWTYLRSGLG